MWYHRQHKLHLGNVLELSTDEMVAHIKKKRINQARFTNINKISNLELEVSSFEDAITSRIAARDAL
ncbi:hypothetical protein H5410_001706 [Solanum commersonii]|uniref:Uncharacterized protein n=1 Tax=Solanum commersonii TaxID=4109 RepID=A0A9J6AZJ1_SOLCO|nr:hypothetical protein H5410_001706 [Solanum commersonii]